MTSSTKRLKASGVRPGRSLRAGLWGGGLALFALLAVSPPVVGQNAIGGSGDLGTQVPRDNRYDPIGGRQRLLPQSSIGEGETVRNRPRPDYDAQGQYVGGLILYPSLTFSENFNDNIFADEDGEEADLISIIAPEFRLQSDWGRHALVFDGSADIGLHAFNPDENFEDYALGIGGRLDIQDEAYISSNLSFQDLHERRGSPDDVSGEAPTEYDLYTGALVGYWPRGQFNLRLSGDVRRLDFDDVGAGPGLPDIDNDDRDRNIYRGTARVGYVIQPKYEAFLRGNYNIRDYDQTVDNEGFERSSQGFEIDAGVEIDFSGLIFGDFFIGYSLQDFDDSALQTVDGVNGGADITWNVTPLTTINFALRSEIEDSTIAGASGFQSYQGGITVDHELLRSLILTARAGGTLAKYDGIDREDTIFNAGLSARYFLNRYVNTAAGYRYRTRLSSASNVEEFDENVVTLSLTVQY